MSEISDKIANDDRINNIFRPTMPSEPPKATNAFSDGTNPESIGSGQQVGDTGFGRIKYDATNGRILMYDASGNIVISIDSNG